MKFCANVSTLLIGRSAAREQDLAVRLALGASRARILGALVVEVVLLVLAASSAGVLLAAGTVRAIRASQSSGLPRLAAVAIDWPVLLLALGVAAIVAAACALGPASCMRPIQASAFRRAPGVGRLAGRRSSCVR